MIATIYEDFYKSAMLAPKNAKLVLRHSIRDKIPDGSNGLDILLTPEGKKMAEHFGRFCNFDLDRIYSSTVERCLQSARLISSGYEKTHGRSISVLPTDILFNSYIYDEILADELFIKYPPQWIIEQFLSAKNLSGMKPLHECMRILFSFIFANDTDKMEIFVTHDTFVNSLVCFCHGISPSLCHSMWPYMLEGAFFYREKDRIHCIFRGVDKYVVFDLKS